MNKNTFVSDKRLYLDKAGNVVGEKNPNKHTLLVTAGGSLPYEEAEKYGLTNVDADAPVEEEAEEDTGEAEESKPASKAAAKKPAAKAPARKR